MEEEGRALSTRLLRWGSIHHLSLGIVAAIATTASIAGADAEETARAIAQPLFDDGVKLMDEAHCDDEVVPPDRRPRCREALDKFKKAFAIYPAGLGALRNAAFCERGLGMVASATRDFREVARRAPLDPNPSKQLWAKHAADEADKLSKSVPHLVIPTPEPKHARVTLDGETIPAAAYGVPIPVDPGAHVVEADAPSHEGFRRTVDVEPKEDVSIPVRLHPVIAAPPPRARSYAVPAALIGGGVVVAGAGLGFGWIAKRTRDDACDIDVSPIHCHDASGLDRAKRWAVASTITTSVGVGLALAGTAVVVFGGKQRDVAAAFAPIAGGGIFGARGHF